MTFAVEKTVAFITIITLTIAYLMIVFNYLFKSGIHGLSAPSHSSVQVKIFENEPEYNHFERRKHFRYTHHRMNILKYLS